MCARSTELFSTDVGYNALLKLFYSIVAISAVFLVQKIQYSKFQIHKIKLMVVYKI